MYKGIIRLALVDDHPVVLEGLKSLFTANEGKYKLSCFADGNSFLSFLAKNQVDIVLLDIALPDANRADICKTVKTSHPQIIVARTQQPGRAKYHPANAPKRRFRFPVEKCSA